MRAIVLAALLTSLTACSDPGAGTPTPATDSGATDAAHDSGTVDVAHPTDAALTSSTLESTIFTGHCAIPSCHVGPGPTGNLDLSAGHSRASLVNVQAMGVECSGTSEIRVVPGNPSNSLLYLKVSQTMPPCGTQMPQGLPALDPSFVALIAEWIDAGAP